MAYFTPPSVSIELKDLLPSAYDEKPVEEPRKIEVNTLAVELSENGGKDIYVNLYEAAKFLRVTYSMIRLAIANGDLRNYRFDDKDHVKKEDLIALLNQNKKIG